jgi:hypothetical protein
MFSWLVADSRCWFVLREEYYWLVVGGWFVLREKYCWLVADKPSEQGVHLVSCALASSPPPSSSDIVVATVARRARRTWWDPIRRRF